MTKFFFSILFTISALITHAGNPGEGTPIKVKTGESIVAWTAKKVTGKHNGSIAIKEGQLNIIDGILTGGSFVIDMTSITVLDLQGGSKAKLENHLKSSDFFNVDTFSTATLVVTDAKVTGIGQYDIKADLTIKGITHPIEFTAVVKPEGQSYIATAEIKVDRTLYDVRYGSKKFFPGIGDSMIFDEFDLSVTLVAGE